MNNKKLNDYIEGKIKETEKLKLELTTQDYKSDVILASIALLEDRKDTYNNILQFLDENKEELKEKKYCIKGKFYLKSGVVIEEVGKSIYNTEEEALENIYNLQEEISKTVKLGEQNISIDNVVIIYTELAAAQFEIVKE